MEILQRNNLGGLCVSSTILDQLKHLLMLTEEIGWDVLYGENCDNTGHTSYYQVRLKDMDGEDYQTSLIPVSETNLDVSIEFAAIVFAGKIHHAQTIVDFMIKKFKSQLEEDFEDVSDEEYSYYLGKFKEKLPEFEAAKISLIIDEDRRMAYYTNMSSREKGHIKGMRIYPISKAGYTSAVKAMQASRRYYQNKPEKSKKSASM